MTTAPRISTQARTSAETDIRLELNLDGQGKTDIATGFGLLDHMLTLTFFWAGMDLTLVCRGDMQVDAHHTAEDVGMTLGKALLDFIEKSHGFSLSYRNDVLTWKYSSQPRRGRRRGPAKRPFPAS